MAVNWSQDAETFITNALGLVPAVGWLLSSLVTVLGPNDDPDVWDEIRAQVQDLIKQAISQDDYARVQAALGTSPISGLLGEINHFTDAVQGRNGEDPKGTWITANGVFIDQSSVFMQKGAEILLLPLLPKWPTSISVFFVMGLRRDSAMSLSYRTIPPLTSRGQISGPLQPFKMPESSSKRSLTRSTKWFASCRSMFRISRGCGCISIEPSTLTQ